MNPPHRREPPGAAYQERNVSVGAARSIANVSVQDTARASGGEVRGVRTGRGDYADHDAGARDAGSEDGRKW